LPYALNAQGITVATQPELEAFLTIAYQSIYGTQIDLSPSSQDGQMLEIYVQAQLDVVAIVLSDYNSRDANSATGTQLDTLFWWLPRQGGTYTIQNLSLVLNAATTLWGTDQTIQPATTYQDATGNEYALQVTQNPAGAGTYVYAFEATEPGAISSTLNTITVPVTVNLAITSARNPTTYTSLGQNEETDFAYRIRGLASTTIASQGFFGSLFASLGIVPGDSTINLYENYLQSVSTGSAPPNVPAGIPGNCIWAIVGGSALPVNIATAIYNQRSLGCNMKGLQTYNITQADGSIFTVQWDNITTENLYIKFTAGSVNGITPPNLPLILKNLPTVLTFLPGQIASIGEVITAIQGIDPNTLVTNCGLSTSSGGSFTNTLATTAGNYQFVLASSQINILPMQLLPATSAVAPATHITFIAYGGIAPYTYSISVNNSSGSINGSTGVYVAGATPATDTILVTDNVGNTMTASVVVT